jgi:hypothetical protein
VTEDEPPREAVVEPVGEPVGELGGAPVRQRRPLLERVGMAAIALVMAALFGLVAAAAWVSGEVFLGAMGAIGCFMTLWVGAITLLRG